MRCCEGGEKARSGTVPTERFIDCAGQLIDAGCDINATNFAGNTALHVAFQHRKNEMADFLIGAGAKPCKNRCQKCSLNIKIRDRAGRATKKTSADTNKCHNTNTNALTKEASADEVLEEEFGNVDFMQELARMKAETGLDGAFKFGGGSFKSQDCAGGAEFGPEAHKLENTGVGGNGGFGDQTAPAISKKKKKKQKKKKGK